MTVEEAKDVFLNRGFVKVNGGEVFDGDKWRQSVVVISEWLEQEPCEDCISREELLEQISIWGGDTDTLIEYIKGMPSVTPVTQWHKLEVRPLTDKEKEVYGEEYDFIYDCKMPSDGQEVLVKTQYGIEKTTYYTDYGCYFEEYEDKDDVIAWTELPEWEE